MNKTKRLKPVRHTSAPQNTETTTLASASGAPATVASTSSILMAMPVPGIDRGHAARANFFHRLSREAGIVAIRAAIAAGVELLEAKREYPGGFQKWVESKCDFGVATAYRYMEVAKKTLPEIDRLLYLPSGDRVPAIEAAATSTDSRTLTDLYVDIGIVKRTPSKMGGARPGAGRKPKAQDVESALDAVAQNETLLWTSAKGALDTLVQLDADKDFLHRLSDEHLAAVVSCLEPLAEKARKLFADRATAAAIQP